MLQASQTLALLKKDKTLAKDVDQKLQAGAQQDILKATAIYPHQDLVMMKVTDTLAALGDPATVIGLAESMLTTRSHVVGLQYLRVRGYFDLGKFDVAAGIWQPVKTTRPNAACLPLSEFIYQYKVGHFPEALALGQKIIQGFNRKTEPADARYVVDTAYRAAIRIPAVDTAIEILKICAGRWPELRASSWLLIGQLAANRTPSQMSPEALAAFKAALSFSLAKDRAAVTAQIPGGYRAHLN